MLRSHAQCIRRAACARQVSRCCGALRAVAGARSLGAVLGHRRASKAGRPARCTRRSLQINVSAQSLASGKYASFALEQLAQAGLPAKPLSASRSRSLRRSTASRTRSTCPRAHTRRLFKIALDDFGYGLSSLAHLKRLPVQYLKIDGRFVRRILDDRVAESIVSGIAQAAKTLGVSHDRGACRERRIGRSSCASSRSISVKGSFSAARRPLARNRGRRLELPSPASHDERCSQPPRRYPVHIGRAQSNL